VQDDPARAQGLVEPEVAAPQQREDAQERGLLG
jgi:hypothetical protein